MPTYEYRCEANGRLVEVRHRMAEKLRTWGELCERAGIPAGRTNPQAPVEKLLSAGFISVDSAKSPAWEGGACGQQVCGTGECNAGPCGSGGCGT